MEDFEAEVAASVGPFIVLLGQDGADEVMRLDDGISRRLVGNQFTTEYADGRLEQHDVRDEEVGDALADLDVVLTAEELDRLQHVLATSRA